MKTAELDPEGRLVCMGARHDATCPTRVCETSVISSLRVRSDSPAKLSGVGILCAKAFDYKFGFLNR